MKRRVQKRGFTLIELLIVFSIMGVITGVVLAKYRGYGTNANFSNSSESIVLTIRQAQVYGVGVRSNTVVCTGGVTNFDCGYGASFSLASPGTMTLFADNNNNGVFDGGAEAIQTVTWDPLTTITNLKCDSGAGLVACPGNTLNITFRRPNPSATIQDSGPTTYLAGSITVSNGTKTTVITVTKAGQISLQ